MSQLDILSKNIYSISFYSTKELIVLWAIIISIMTGIIIGSQFTPNLLSQSIIDEQSCQNNLNYPGTRLLQQLKNIQGFVKDDFKLFENIKTKTLMCVLCITSSPEKVPYGVGMKIMGNFDQYISQFQQFSSQVTVVSSSIKQDKCIRRNLNLTSLSQFPQVQNVDDNHLQIEQNSKQLNQTWQCSKQTFSDYTECQSLQLIYNNNKGFKSLLLFHRIDSPQLAFRNPSIQYFYIKYNDRYFQINEILFMAWIGVEIIFFVIILYLKEIKKELIDSALVGCSRNYLLILFAILLNNEVFLPIQMIKDSENLRIINMICQTISLCIMLSFILQCFRNIRSLQVVSILPLDVIVILYFGICMVVFQIRAVKTFHTTLINNVFMQNLFQIINLEYRLLESAIIIFFTYFSFHVIHTLYKFQLFLDQTEKLEKQYIKSCRLFVFYSSFFAYGIFIRLIIQYLLIFSIDIIYFDQIITGFINLFYFLLWNLFDQDESLTNLEAEFEEIELKSERNADIQNDIKQDIFNGTFRIIQEDVKIDKNITFDLKENKES